MPRHDLQGNLDLVVLKTLAQRGKLHGYGIVLHIHSESDELLQVEAGGRIQRCTAWSKADGSIQNGLSLKRGGGQSTTA